MTNDYDDLICDPCGAPDATTCDHGVDMCSDCDSEGACVLCDRERAEDIADDIATERALDEWRGLTA
jgi:hypothetical protein